MDIAGQAVADRLRVELARLQKPSAFEVLGVPPHATGAAVRAAFLALTKRYHPARFARESPEAVELATEIFLLVRKAYTSIADDGRRDSLRAQSMAVLVPSSPPAAPVAAPVATPVAAPAPAARPARPPVAPRRPPADPPSPQAPRRHARPMPPERLAAHPPRRRAITPPVGTPIGQRNADVEAMLAAVRTRSTRFEKAHELLADGRTGEAVPLLRQLVTEDPQNRRYRQRYLLALGLEHRDEGRLDDAVRELERALHLDPEADDVASALRAVREQRDSGRSGILSKFFGR